MGNNPAHFCYNRVDNVESLAAPSAVFVCDYGNLKAPEIQRARGKGAEVLVYRNMLHVSVPNSDEERVWFMGDSARVPRWPYKTASGEYRSNWPGAQLIDISDGSPWLPYFEEQLSLLIRSGLADGIFSDSHGARLWSSLVAWDTWTTAEQANWAFGCVGAAKRADEVRRRENPRFKIVHNGNWILPTSHTAYAVALDGERYCDGVCIEHHAPTKPFHVAYAAKPFNNLGQRRVIVVANNLSEALAWSVLPGVTHVASVNTASGENYQRSVPVPGIPYTDLRLDEERAYSAWLRDELRDLGLDYIALEGQAQEALEKLSVAERQRDEARLQTLERERRITDAIAVLQRNPT